MWTRFFWISPPSQAPRASELRLKSVFDNAILLKHSTLKKMRVRHSTSRLTLRTATSETSTVGIERGGAYAPIEMSGLVSSPGLKFGPVKGLIHYYIIACNFSRKSGIFWRKLLKSKKSWSVSTFFLLRTIFFKRCRREMVDVAPRMQEIACNNCIVYRPLNRPSW